MNVLTQIILLLALGLVAAVALGYLLLQCRSTPDKRERRRRLWLARTGRMHYGMLTDFHDESLYYSYVVRGVQYTASQDVSRLHAHLPAEQALLLGSVTLRYAAQNPANSIVLCERWSGLRKAGNVRETTGASLVKN